MMENASFLDNLIISILLMSHLNNDYKYVFFLEPDVFPVVNITSNSSQAFEIVITEKPLEHLLNGILRFITVLYNITSPTDLDKKQYNYTLPVNHILFFENADPFSFLLKNLTAYTNYSVQLVYVTVKPGNWSKATHKRTPIDSKLRFLKTNNTSTRSQVLDRVAVLKNLRKISGKPLQQSLFSSKVTVWGFAGLSYFI